MVSLGMTLLTPMAAHFRYSHAVNANFYESAFHSFKPIRLNDCLEFRHSLLLFKFRSIHLQYPGAISSGGPDLFAVGRPGSVWVNSFHCQSRAGTTAESNTGSIAVGNGRSAYHGAWRRQNGVLRHPGG